MDRYTLPALEKVTRQFYLPHNRSITGAVYDDIEEFSRIVAFPGALSKTEVEAERVEKRQNILSCPTQGAATCAIDSVLTVARYLGIARNALDNAFCRSSIPHPAGTMLQFLDTSWAAVGPRSLNAQRDTLQTAILSYMQSIGEDCPDGYLDPRSLWKMFNGIPSTSFTLAHCRTCPSCLTLSQPVQESASLIYLPDRFISSAAYARLTSPPSATIIQDLVQLRLSTEAVPVAVPCTECDSEIQEEDTYIADRLPEFLAIGIEGSDDGCAHYAPDFVIRHRRLQQTRAAAPHYARYSLVALLHITGKKAAAHITASVRACTDERASWIYFDGARSPPIRICQQDEEVYLSSAPQCVMAVYKSKAEYYTA